VLKVCRTPGPTACLKMLSKVCLKTRRCINAIWCINAMHMTLLFCTQECINEKQRQYIQYILSSRREYILYIVYIVYTASVSCYWTPGIFIFIYLCFTAEVLKGCRIPGPITCFIPTC